MNDSMLESEDIAGLVKQFPKIDSALVAAIAGEHEDLSSISTILNQLTLETADQDEPPDWNQHKTGEEDNKDQSEAEFDQFHRDLKFLQRSFPGISKATIEVKLRSANGDIVKVTDELLNHSVVQEVGNDAYFSQTPHDKKLQSKKKRNGQNKLTLRLENSSNESVNSIESSSGRTSFNTSRVSTPSSRTFIASPMPSPVSTPISRSFKSVEEIETARHEANAKAQEAYRKARSDKLFKPVTGYYSNIASQLTVEKTQAIRLQDEALFARQVSDYEIDCHGMTVKFATEACIIKLHKWWTGELSAREQRVSRSVHALRIITGAGIHSEGGKSKIKIAIRKVLDKDHWRYQEFTSDFIVNGVR